LKPLRGLMWKALDIGLIGYFAFLSTSALHAPNYIVSLFYRVHYDIITIAGTLSLLILLPIFVRVSGWKATPFLLCLTGVGEDVSACISNTFNLGGQQAINWLSNYMKVNVTLWAVLILIPLAFGFRYSLGWRYLALPLVGTYVWSLGKVFVPLSPYQTWLIAEPIILALSAFCATKILRTTP
jgi:hypothetical protein